MPREHRDGPDQASDISPVALSIDVACFVLLQEELHVLLVRRARDPFQGQWALPGGIVLPDEHLDDAPVRLLRDRTGLVTSYLEQLYTFGSPDRDPRGRTVSVAYMALLRENEHIVKQGRDVLEIGYFPARADAGRPPLAFDHDDMVDYAIERLQQKIYYVPLAFRLLPARFTMSDLRSVYEAILKETLHPSNFAKRMQATFELTRTPDFVPGRYKKPAASWRYTGSPEIVGPPVRQKATPDLHDER